MNKTHTPEYKPPQFWVYEGEILRAAQSTFYGALQYSGPGRMIVTQPRNSKGLPK